MKGAGRLGVITSKNNERLHSENSDSHNKRLTSNSERQNSENNQPDTDENLTNDRK